MRRIIFIATVLVFSAGVANAALVTSSFSGTVIDFSQFVGANQHSAFGSPVQVGGLVGADVTLSGDPFTGSDGAWLWNDTWGLGSNGNWNSGRDGYAGYAWGDMTGTALFSFDVAVTSVGAFINDAPGYGGDFTIAAYDASMNLLESHDIWAEAGGISTTGYNNGAFRGITGTAPISFFAVTGFVPVIDDLTFTPVPVPGAVLLGMLGLSLAGIKLRKRA